MSGQTFEIKTLLVSGRELNRSVFRQLEEIDYKTVIIENYSANIQEPNLIIIGKVNYPELVKHEKSIYLFHFLCSSKGLLYKAACYRHWRFGLPLYTRVRDGALIRSINDKGYNYEGDFIYSGSELVYKRCSSPEASFNFEDFPQIFLRA